MDFYIYIVGMAVLSTIILYFFIKFPELRALRPFIMAIIRGTILSIDNSKSKKIYKNLMSAELKFIASLDLSQLEYTSIDSVSLKYKVSDFVKNNFANYYKDGGHDKVEAERIASVIFAMLVANKELHDTITALLHKHPENVEVKRLTVLAIDVFGSVFDLKDKLNYQYYEHLIYAINKCLLILREDGLSERTLKRSGAVLFRLYKLTMAYNRLKSPQTIQGIHKDVQKIFDLLFSS